LGRIIRHIVLALFFYGPTIASAQLSLFDTVELKEIEIRDTRSFFQKGDTLNYFADSFGKSRQATLENMFKRMPGFDVDAAGNILIQGKPLGRLYINGTEVDIDDYRIITQNLPSDIVQRIQTMDNRSDEEVLVGSKAASQDKAINIQLDEDINGGVTGKVSAGGGIKNKYQAGNFLNYMNEATRITSIANANNVNNSELNDVPNVKSLSGIPGISGLGIVNLNYSFKPGKKLKISGNIDASNRHLDLQQNIERTTFLPDEELYIQRKFTTTGSRTSNYRFSSRADYSINRSAKLLCNINLTFDDNSSEEYSNDTFFHRNDGQNTTFRTDGTVSTRITPKLNAQISYQKRFSKTGRTFLMSIDQRNAGNSNSSTNNYSTTDSRSLFVIRNRNSAEQFQTENASSLRVQYSEPIGRDLVLFQYDYKLFKSGDRLAVYNGINQLDPTQSYNNSYDYDQHNIWMKYNFQRKYLSVLGGVSMVYLKSENIRLQESSTPSIEIRKSFVPFLNVKVQASKNLSVEMLYDGEMSPPNVSQLQGKSNYTDSFSVYRGNPELAPQISSNVQSSLNYANSKAELFSLVFSHSWVTNQIVDQTSIIGNKQYVSPVNINGNYTSSVTVTGSKKLLTGVHAFLNITTRLNNIVIPVNSILQNNRQTSVVPQMRLNYLTEKVSFDAAYAYASSSMSDGMDGISSVSNHLLQFNGKIILPGVITFAGGVHYSSYKGYINSPSDNYYEISASLFKELTKSKNLCIKLQGNNILNRIPNVQRVMGNAYIQDSYYNRIGRFFLLSVIYRYSYFPRKQL
jgi:hypothetical protein